jgi:hypothetical protein
MKQDKQVDTNTVPTITPRKIRILKISQCPNLSGSATLTYQIGIADEKEILFRVDANSSSGYFSREWVQLVDIQRVFAEVPADSYITSYTLHSLLIGKSTNTCGYILACILAEKLVQRSSIEDRGYECTDGKEFFTSVQSLIDANVSLDPDAKPKKLIKKKSVTEAVPSTD